DARARAADAALGEQRVQHGQQVQVQGADIHGVNVLYTKQPFGEYATGGHHGGQRSFHMDTANDTAVSSSFSANPTPATARTATWDIDSSHANAGFRVRHLMVSHVRGHLGPVTGTVFIDEQDLSRSRIDVSVDVR